MIDKINNFVEVKFDLILETGKKIGINSEKLATAIQGIKDRNAMCDFSQISDEDITLTISILKNNLEDIRKGVFSKSSNYCTHCILAKYDCNTCPVPVDVGCRTEDNPYVDMRKILGKHETRWLMDNVDNETLYNILIAPLT